METTGNASESVNYDDAAIVQEHVDGVDYRVDAGRGSAVAVSSRMEGTWTWQWVAEGRWDGVRLRVKGLDHPVVSALEKALARTMKDRSESGWA